MMMIGISIYIYIYIWTITILDNATAKEETNLATYIYM
jgi:hypothetical protein